MKTIQLLVALVVLSFSGCSQNNNKEKSRSTDKKVGGNCEGCEAVYESPTPFEELNEIDTLPDFNETGPKIEISGRIFKADGKTAAPGVILYVYHTDQKGLYPKTDKSKGWEQRHGYIRGWVKSDANGNYKFYTLVPASYPNSNNPKHIHPTIKEPGYTEYWIGEFLFDDDPLLPVSEKNKASAVGGNGVLKTEMRDGMLRAKRDIILGMNVRDYK